jgi:hypothetical protein
MIVLQPIRNWIAVVMRGRIVGKFVVNVSSGDWPMNGRGAPSFGARRTN